MIDLGNKNGLVEIQDFWYPLAIYGIVGPLSSMMYLFKMVMSHSYVKWPAKLLIPGMMIHDWERTCGVRRASWEPMFYLLLWTTCYEYPFISIPIHLFDSYHFMSLYFSVISPLLYRFVSVTHFFLPLDDFLDHCGAGTLNPSPEYQHLLNIATWINDWASLGGCKEFKRLDCLHPMKWNGHSPMKQQKWVDQWNSSMEINHQFNRIEIWVQPLDLDMSPLRFHLQFGAVSPWVSIWWWYFMRNADMADMGIQCKKIWHVGNALSNDDMRWQAIFRTYEPSRNVGAEMGEWFVPGFFDPLFGEDYHGWS